MPDPMDELQLFFKDSAADHAQALERLSGPVATRDKTAIEQARHIAHSLKGSGTSYGYPEITAAAATAEASEDDDLVETLADLREALLEIVQPTRRSLVLIVDDDPLISRLLEARITTGERRVTTMASLEAARQFLDEHTPDLILLDLFLPDGDGRMFLTEIRHREELTGTPVLVVSGADGGHIRDETLRLGADGFIAKPFAVDEVVAQVSKTLRPDGTTAPVGRSALTSTYRTLLEREIEATVIAVIPETHGPGGKRSDGSDPAMTGPVLEALMESLGGDGTAAEWAEGEIAVVTAAEPTDVARTLDRARLHLRTQPHPLAEGALVSFSAAVVTDTGRGLNDSYWRAHRFALDANQQGGDRVSVARPERRGNRVLLAEDDTLTAALIIHRLEREGFEVIHHLDGTSALESAEAEDFGLVILDVQMPGMDGFEVLERLRAMRSLDDTPIVMLTAVGWERDVVRGFEMGANDYILKPFSPAELTARLKRFSRV